MCSVMRLADAEARPFGGLGVGAADKAPVVLTDVGEEVEGAKPAEPRPKLGRRLIARLTASSSKKADDKNTSLSNIVSRSLLLLLPPPFEEEGSLKETPPQHPPNRRRRWTRGGSLARARG